jgi:hypothetical protein
LGIIPIVFFVEVTVLFLFKLLAMKTHKSIKAILLLCLISFIFSCKKDKDSSTDPTATLTDSCLSVLMIDSSSFGLQIAYENRKPISMNLVKQTEPNKWEMDQWLVLKYNAKGQLSDFIEHYQGNKYEFDRIYYNSLGKITEVWSYDSTEGENAVQYGTTFPTYDANNKISRIDYIEDGDTIFYLDAFYDWRGQLSEIIGYFPLKAGGFVPMFKNKFLSDEEPQNSYLYATYFAKDEGFYLLFNQAGQRQTGGYMEYSYDDFYKKWVKTGDYIIKNYYDQNKRLQRSESAGKNYTYYYDCK